MSRLGSIGNRLYRGEVSVDFVGRQRLWYAISGVILILSLIGVFTRGLNFTVDFKGGSVFKFPVGHASIVQVQNAVSAYTPMVITMSCSSAIIAELAIRHSNAMDR